MCVPWRLSGQDQTLSPSPARAQPGKSHARRCLLASYLYFTAQEGIGFPELIRNYRDLGSLEKLTDPESSDSAPASQCPSQPRCPHPGHPQPTLLPADGNGGRQPANFTCGERLLVSAGSSLDRTAN